MKVKKITFFNFLKPIIKKENQAVTNERSVFLNIKHNFKTNNKLNSKDKKIILALAKKYKVDVNLDDISQLNELLIRVDIIPSALTLIQAAKESGWDTSRFAREGNNYFGLWCYTKGCGIIPNSRSKNAIHEVTKFSSVEQSVRSYIHNINSHEAYAALRKTRANLRKNNTPITADILVNDLINYSQRREQYVNEIKAMLKSNKAYLN